MAALVYRDKTAKLATTSVIGRQHTCNLVIGDPSVSRQHARVYQVDGAWMIEDLHSSTGTTVNGQPLIMGAAPLADGDLIKVGDIEIGFRAGDQPAVAAGATPTTDATALAGRIMGEYHVDAFERQEVAGPLYRARHTATGRVVHLWVMDPRLHALEDEEFPERLAGWLKMAAVRSHPDLMRIYHCSRTDGLLWYTTEIVEGRSLAQVIHQGITPERAIGITVDLCRLLEAYHDAGVVHGDIKPSVVVIDAAGKVRIASFGLLGISAASRRTLQAEGSTRQVFYLCPSQAATGEPNARSDMYSVACILVHMLTGRPPYLGNSFQEVLDAHIAQPIPQLAAAHGLPPKFDEILASMLNKDPFFRYDNLGFVLKDFERLKRAMVA
jgi:hypothetical protein